MRALVSAAVMSAVLIVVFFVPMPHFVWTHFVVQPEGAQKVYVRYPGVLEKLHVQSGDRVQQGQSLATLSNVDLEIELLKLETELAKLGADVDAYRASNLEPIRAAQLIQNATTSIVGIQQKIKIKRQQFESLELVAEQNGTILPPPNAPTVPETDRMQLASWSGTPLDQKNQSALLPRETLFCYVGQPTKMRAVLVCEQSDAKFLEVGQDVSLKLNAYRDFEFEGSIHRVAREELSELPRELSKNNGGAIATTPTASGAEQPLMKSFEASVLLENVQQVEMLPGMHGVAKIRIGSTSIGTRLWRQFQTTLKFR